MTSAAPLTAAIANFLDPAICDCSEFAATSPSQDYAKDLKAKTALRSTSVQSRKSKGPTIAGWALDLVGGAKRDRTVDLYNAIVAL
ncbi:MAG: hypothetical protein PSV46_21520, partial [Reyranella sp.]|nr:hypothetical protein [Reyranella sp.]